MFKEKESVKSRITQIGSKTLAGHLPFSIKMLNVENFPSRYGFPALHDSNKQLSTLVDKFVITSSELKDEKEETIQIEQNDVSGKKCMIM